MSERDATYVQRVAAAVERIDTYLAGVSEESFGKTPLVRDAVLRNLEVISEASRRLSARFKERYPNVPWAEMAAAGNIYRHEYDRVQDDVIWETATAGLESLRDMIQHETER